MWGVMLTGEQIRAARALLRIEQAELAERSGVSLPTIKRLEKTQGPVGGLARTAMTIQQVLEKAGIVFLDEDEEVGVGVRLVKGLSGATEHH